MNQLWAILPVKPFGEGKSRLAERLDSDERAALSQQLLTKVIQAVHESKVCTEILVISRDPNVLTYTQSLNTSTLLEADNPQQTPTLSKKPRLLQEDSLNAALRQSATEAASRGADAVLVLPADLPLITPKDIVDLAAAGCHGPCVVIAPSEDSGTNALLLNPPESIDFSFGLRSFERHQALAQAKNIPLKILHSSTLAFDVDRPADLAELARLATT